MSLLLLHSTFFMTALLVNSYVVLSMFMPESEEPTGETPK